MVKRFELSEEPAAITLCINLVGKQTLYRKQETLKALIRSVNPLVRSDEHLPHLLNKLDFLSAPLLTQKRL